MRRTTKKILLALMATLGMWSTAAAQTKIVVNFADGRAAQEFLLEDVGKVVFGAEQLTLGGVAGETLQAYSLADILSIKFKDLPTAIESPVADTGSELRLFCRDGQLQAEGLPVDGDAVAAVYDLSGRPVMARRAWSGEPISVSSLPKGVYIFKVNNKTIKFAR